MSPGQFPPGAHPAPGQPGGRFPSGSPAPASRRSLALVIGVLAVLALVATGLVVTTLLRPGDGDPAASSAAPAGASTGDAGGTVEVNVEVGDCIHLEGSEEAAAARPAECGTPDSNHRVIGKAPKSEECISDADAVYYETLLLGAGEAGALCLDVDWVPGACYDLGGDSVQRVDCAAPGTEVARVVETIQGTSDKSACDVGGVGYAQRNFIVCLEDPTP